MNLEGMKKAHIGKKRGTVSIVAVVAIKCYCRPGYMVLGLKKTKALLLTTTSISILSSFAITFYILVTADHWEICISKGRGHKEYIAIKLPRLAYHLPQKFLRVPK